jgi:hypothetical protein
VRWKRKNCQVAEGIAAGREKAGWNNEWASRGERDTAKQASKQATESSSSKEEKESR